MKKIPFKTFSWMIVLYLIVYAVLYSQHVSLDYDGYMNLQVPVSLVKDGIYASRYNGLSPFWIHIQTGPTVLFPIAISFKIFGINVYSAKIVLILYFFFLLLLLVITLRYIYKYDEVVAVGLISLLFTPQTFNLALGGYGEFPAFFWLTLSIFLLIKGSEQRGSKIYAFLSGVCGSFALLTKLLSFLTVFSISGLLLLFWYADKKEREKKTVLLRMWFAGFLAPLVVWEVYKFVSLQKFYHTPHAYIERWEVLLNAMKMEGRGEHLRLHSLFGRAKVNFSELTGSMKLSPFVLFIAFLLSFAVYLGSINRENIFKYTLILALIIPHLFWWIFFSPRPWFRRVVVPVLSWRVFVLAPSFVFAFRALFQKETSIKKKIFYAVSVIITGVVLFSTFKVRVPFKLPLRYDQKYLAQKDMAEFVSHLSPDVWILGYGWWQSPAISFLSGTDFLNAEDDENIEKISNHPAYILLGEEHRFLDPPSYTKIMMSTVGERVKKSKWFYELYEYTRMGFHENQLRFVLKKFDVKRWVSYIKLSPKDYSREQIGLGICPYLHGEFRWKGDFKGCVVQNKGVVWLRYNGERHLIIKGHTLPETEKILPLNLDVYLNDELVGVFTITQKGKFSFEVDVSGFSSPYSVVRVLLESNRYFSIFNRRRYSPFFLARSKALTFTLEEIGFE